MHSAGGTDTYRTAASYRAGLTDDYRTASSGVGQQAAASRGTAARRGEEESGESYKTAVQSNISGDYMTAARGTSLTDQPYHTASEYRTNSSDYR